MSEVAEHGALTRGELYGDLLYAAGVEYEIAISMRTGRGEAVVAGLGRTEREFSERDRDVLDIARRRSRVRCVPRRRAGATSARSLTILRPAPP